MCCAGICLKVVVRMFPMTQNYENSKSQESRLIEFKFYAKASTSEPQEDPDRHQKNLCMKPVSLRPVHYVVFKWLCGVCVERNFLHQSTTLMLNVEFSGGLKGKRFGKSLACIREHVEGTTD